MQPIGRTVRLPFDGNPETWEETDKNGNPEFHVTARTLTPPRARVADGLGVATAAAVPALSILYVMNHDPTVPALAFAGATWFLRPLFEKLWREALKRKVDMVVTADEFRFRAGLKWIAFDRALQHRFALVLHDLARWERDKHELEVLKARERRKIVQPRRYYQDSYHFIYELVGQRNDITEIFGKPDAQAVLTRLRAIDEVINACAKRGGGTAINPGDQWVEQPGAIPESGDC
jgi:hypothetical protein